MSAKSDSVAVVPAGKPIDLFRVGSILPIAFVLFAASAAVDLMRTSWRSEAGSLAPIVLALGGYTLWRDFSRSRGLAQPGKAIIWLPILAQASVFLIFGSAIAMASLGALAAWLAGVAVLYALNGWQVIRRCAFPLIFLALVVPLPYTLAMPANAALRAFVAERAVALAAWLGMNVAQEPGVVIVEQYVLAIENACAGANSTLTLVSLSVLYAYWIRTRSVARAWLAGALAIPIAMAANIGRVVALMAMVQWQGSAILDTAIHPLSGFISFALAATLLVWVDRAANQFARYRQ
jgi:exosortase